MASGKSRVKYIFPILLMFFNSEILSLAALFTLTVFILSGIVKEAGRNGI